MPSAISLRVRHLLATRGPTLVLALAVVGLVALGGAGWVYTHPPSTTVTSEEQVASVHSGVVERAVVTGNATLYERGRTLVEPPVFFLPATPNVTLTLSTTVPADRAVRIDQRLCLRLRAQHQGQTFWRDTRRLARTNVTTTTGIVNTTATLDAAALRERLEEKRAAVGEAGTVDAALHYRVHYQVGTSVATYSARLPISFGQGYYSVAEQPTTRTHGETTTRRVYTEPNPAVYAPLAGLGVLASLGAAGAAVAYRRTDHATDTESLRRRLVAERYAEWISAGDLSGVSVDGRVRIDSLTDLVDVAIDTDERVIHDEDRELYGAVDGRTLYYYHYGEGATGIGTGREWNWADASPADDGGDRRNPSAGESGGGDDGRRGERR